MIDADVEQAADEDDRAEDVANARDEAWSQNMPSNCGMVDC